MLKCPVVCEDETKLPTHGEVVCNVNAKKFIPIKGFACKGLINLTLLVRERDINQKLL